MAFALFPFVLSVANASSVSTPAPERPADADRVQILVVGDSLSAEYGIRRNTGWVELMRKQLAMETGKPLKIINASISGDTTSGGLSRIKPLLDKHHPEIVIIELGANDALRGLSLDLTRNNLKKMIELAQASGAKAVLAGMQIPPNYGPVYSKAFKDLYPEVASATGAALIPFFLAGLETNRDMFIEDGIHPAEVAQPIIMKNVLEVVSPLIQN